MTEVQPLKKRSRKKNTQQVVVTKKQPEEIIVRKSTSSNVFVSIIWLGFGSVTLGASIMPPFDVGLFFLLLPFTVIFIFVGYTNVKFINNVIVANAHGLLVEDRSKKIISWSRIKFIDMRATYYPKPVCELELIMERDDELFNRLLFKNLRRKLPTRSTSVCNLFDYNINHQYFFERLREMHAYYTK
jgi:hypothetical protein